MKCTYAVEIESKWNKSKKKIIKKYATISLGVALTAVGISVFYTPNKIVNGGVSGVATIIFHTLGIPIGLTLIQGSSTGGTDILSRLVQHFFPQIRIGTLLLIVDSVVIITSLIIFRQINLVLYGALSLFISSYSVNWLVQKLNISKLAFVITDKGFEISKKIVTTSPRGVTLIDATGAYTVCDKQVLICAMKESEAPSFQNKVLDIDSGAFVIFSESQQILGNGFKIYK